MPILNTYYLQVSAAFTQGGLGVMGPPNCGYYGWFGLGGSAFQWHPGHNIGFAYTCSLLTEVPSSQSREGELKVCIQIERHQKQGRAEELF